MCLTETWTTNNNSDPTYIAATPNTHYFIQQSRISHDGGLAVIINYNIILTTTFHRTVNSIELLQLHLKLNKNINTLKLLILYRPHNSINPVLTIHDMLYQLHDEHNLLILGDFNINPRAIIFSNILNDLNLTQHIGESNRIHTVP